MDFTLKTYTLMLEALKVQYKDFCTFSEIESGGLASFAVLRHDVDRDPQNALAMASIEKTMGIKASYHFRIGAGSNQPEIIRKIADLGHEIAYHYEDLSAVCRKQKRTAELSQEVVSIAVSRFSENLEYFRNFYPVKVASMHGSPLSVIDNRILWKYFDYHKRGIICEPYFDIDISDVLYLTDTGRRWDGDKTNLRDRGHIFDPQQKTDPFEGWQSRPVKGSLMNMTEEGIALNNTFSIRYSSDVIKLAKEKRLPAKIIVNTHPQRWNDNALPWLAELVFQNLKNLVKIFIVRS